MRTAVRYYSRSGNTKAVAEAIARAAGVEAISVDNNASSIDDKVDILFVGGALYAYGIDSHLKDFLAGLDRSKVGRAVVFSTSWLSKHSIDLIKKGLSDKGIPVEDEYFYVKNKPNSAQEAEAERFAKKFI
ncbi:MAG: flavodoxin [Butyrivibrio sp.]|nr:flavodoxin [Butyrivibrio sp.]